MSLVEQNTSDVGVFERVGDFDELLRFFRWESGERLLDVLFFGLDLGSRSRIENLPAAVAELRSTVVCPFTGRALDWREVFGLVISGDVDSVGACNLSVARLSEHADVSRGRVTAAYPAVMVLDDGLVSISGSEVCCGGLAIVCQRDRAVDAGFIGRILEDIVEHSVADAFSTVELAPERSVCVSARGMVVEPGVDVRHGGDTEHGPPTLLPVDSHLQSMFVVLDITDSERFELASTESSIELDCNHRSISRIGLRLDHRDDVVMPSEHVARVWSGVIIRRRAGRDPRETIRDLVAIGNSPAKDSQRRAIVSVGFLVLERPVDPFDDGLGSVTVFEAGGEQPILAPFCHECAMSEEFEVPERRVFLGEQAEPVVEVFEGTSVSIGDVLTGIDTIDEVVELDVWVLRHTDELSHPSFISLALNRKFTAGPWLSTLGSKPSPFYTGETQEFGESDTLNPWFKASGSGGGVCV